VFACLTTTFSATARVGEFTILKLDAFSPQRHVMPASVCTEHDRQGLKSTIFHLPSTKASPVHGEDVSWSAQSGLTDPEAAFAHHLHTNNPSNNGPLFAYCFKGGHWPLTKPKLIEVLAKGARELGKVMAFRLGPLLSFYFREYPLTSLKVKG